MYHGSYLLPKNFTNRPNSLYTNLELHIKN